MSGVKRGLPGKRRMRADRHYVDELTERMGEGLGRMVSVDSITSNHDQPRGTLGDLEDLVASIRAHGILEPLLVRRRAEAPNSFELVSGERRFHAALQVGLPEVPCIELTVSDQGALEIALIENLQRKDLTPLEEAEGFRTLVEKYDYTHEQVAHAVGRSRVTVTETLRLLTLPSSVLERCRHADITAKGILLELAKAGSETAMHTLLDAYLKEGADRTTLRDLRAGLAATHGSDEARSDGSAAGTDAARARPFVIRLSHPERRYTVSLSFRTEDEPDPEQVITALEEILGELRARRADEAESAELGEERRASG